MRIVLWLLLIGVAASVTYVLFGRAEQPPTWIAFDRAELRSALAAANRTLLQTTQTTARGGTVAAATALAESIRFSKRQALRAGTRPIPRSIREALEGHFPDDVLDDVRWTPAGRRIGRIGLGSVITTWYYREGAVTLDNIIVFTNARTARHLGLLAHELTHVLQYRELGIRDFARLYTIRWRLLEAQARRNAGRVVAAVERDRRAARAPADQAP